MTVPVAKPATPRTMMTMFLIHVSLPGWNVTSSITGGMIRARKELANAPMREMSRSRCGIRADNPPETERMKLLYYMTFWFL